MSFDLYDEFGNYIGPDIDEDSEEALDEQSQSDGDNAVAIIVDPTGTTQ
jgi:hypothetical protein